MTDRRTLRLLTVVPLLAIAVGSCSPAPPPAEVVATAPTSAPAPAPTPTSAPRLDACPRLDAEPPAPDALSGPVTDWVDFIHHDGRSYIAGLTSTPAVSPADLREVVLESRCSFSDVSASRQQDLGESRDGDTGFLPPGTPVRALAGWPPECRLAVERDGQVVVYLAHHLNGDRVEPAACALD